MDQYDEEIERVRPVWRAWIAAGVDEEIARYRASVEDAARRAGKTHGEMFAQRERGGPTDAERMLAFMSGDIGGRSMWEDVLATRENTLRELERDRGRYLMRGAVVTEGWFRAWALVSREHGSESTFRDVPPMSAWVALDMFHWKTHPEDATAIVSPNALAAWHAWEEGVRAS